MSETVPPPATAITEVSARPKQAANRLINAKSQRPSPETSAQLHARRARNQLRGIPRRIVPKEMLPQALSDAVAVRISPNSAVEGGNW
jgi:hypothetical protein